MASISLVAGKQPGEEEVRLGRDKAEALSLLQSQALWRHTEAQEQAPGIALDPAEVGRRSRPRKKVLKRKAKKDGKALSAAAKTLRKAGLENEAEELENEAAEEMRVAKERNISGLPSREDAEQKLRPLVEVRPEDQAFFPADRQTTGATAPLTNHGYQAVAVLYDEDEMAEFIRRTIASMGLTLTNEDTLNGLVPFYSGKCSVQSFERLEEELAASAADTKCTAHWTEQTAPELLAEDSIEETASKPSKSSDGSLSFIGANPAVHKPRSLRDWQMNLWLKNRSSLNSQASLLSWPLKMDAGMTAASATLDEDGYAEVAELENTTEMAVYVQRVAGQHGLVIPDNEREKLLGMAAWYSGECDVQNYSNIVDELVKGLRRPKDCGGAWVASRNGSRHVAAAVDGGRLLCEDRCNGVPCCIYGKKGNRSVQVYKHPTLFHMNKCLDRLHGKWCRLTGDEVRMPDEDLIQTHKPSLMDTSPSQNFPELELIRDLNDEWMHDDAW